MGDPSPLTQRPTTASHLDVGSHRGLADPSLALAPPPQSDAAVLWWTQPVPVSLGSDSVAPQPDRSGQAEHLVPGRSTELAGSTSEPDLHVLIGKRKIRPGCVDGMRYVFSIPSGVGAVRLVSRVAAPAETTPSLDDHRPLGVAVRRITQRGGCSRFVMEAHHSGLSEGWYAEEAGARGAFRWTDGDARIPVLPGAQVIEVELHSAGVYPVSRLPLPKVA